MNYKKTETKLARIMKSAATQDGHASNKNDCELLLACWRDKTLFRAKGQTLKNGPAPFHYFTTRDAADAFSRRSHAAKVVKSAPVKLWNLPAPVVASVTIVRKPVAKVAPIIFPEFVRVIKCPSPSYTSLVPSRDLSMSPAMRAVRCNADEVAA